MNRWQLFAVVSILSPTFCLSCGEPGLGYSIEVSTEPLVPALGETLELRCRVSDSSRDQWTNGVFTRGSKLMWSEGGVRDWSEYNGRDLVNDFTAGEAILRIANFSVADYGLYRCRCVNDFTFLQYELCGGSDGLETHCSAAKELQLLPADGGTGIHTEFIDSPGTKVSLPQCASGWTTINTSGSLNKVGSEVVVGSPQDQAKFVCPSSVTSNPVNIVYIEIKDYHPLRILYPVSDTADVVLSNRSSQVPVCASLTSASNSTNTSLLLYTNNTVQRLEAESTNNVVALNVEQCGWVRVYFVDEFLVNVIKEAEYSGSFFSCTVSSPWESLSVNFTIHENRTTMPQVCQTPPSSLPVSSEFHSPASTSLPHRDGVDLSTATTISQPIPTTSPPFPVVFDFQTASPPPPSNGGDNNFSTIIAGAVVVLLVVVILIVLGVFFVLVFVWRRRKTASRRMYKLPANDDSFAAEPNLVQPSFINFHITNDTHLLYNGNSVGHQFTHNGVGVSRQMAKCISSLQQSPWLFPYEKLEFLEELGSGAFGVVKKALAHSLQPGEPATVVAVKMLKDNAGYDDEEKDLISELKVLKHVGAHPNIVCLLGAAVNNGMLHVIVEYCFNGNLLNYLRSKRNDQTSPLTARHCVDMAAQVATGMEFLTSKDCIHRDLAARNVLITEDNVLKVADFGLARKVYESVYRPSGGKVPVKWLAPESIIDHVYTAQSDVWSFGIVLWEILTLGRTPYPGKSAETMLRDLEDGYRMPRPPSCPVQIYDVMLKCWHWSSVERPTFSDLVKQLEEILTADEPAINRHYYNMEVSGQPNRDSTIDSTLCSCEDLLDSSIAGPLPLNTCHSCGNSFTTTRVLSSDPTKIFCDDCSQMPEYLSRSSLDLLSTCDESGTVGRRVGRRWSQRLHSNDSGVKVSSEGTSSEFYQVASGVRAMTFARKLAESLQSMCSECKLEPGLGSLWTESSQSISSLCTDCRETLEGHKYTNMLSPTIEEISREREAYMRGRMDRLLGSPPGGKPRPKSIDESLLLSTRGDREEGEGSVEEEREGSVEEEREDGGENVMENGVGEKVELRQKYSNDSGIKLMPEPIYLKRVSAPPLSGNRRISDIKCFSPPTPQCMSLKTSGCSTPASRLSAHPRNRDLFPELGFKETDL